MGTKTLELVKEVESGSAIVVKVYDLCNNKSDYRKILKFFRKCLKKYSRMLNKVGKATAIYEYEKTIIHENLSVTCVIRNCDMEYFHLPEDLKPLEICGFINKDSEEGIHTKGIGYFGGCNEAEFAEFVKILKDGYYDFTKEV